MAVDLAKLKRAIAVVETGDGKNNHPRVEAAYVPLGESFTVQGRILTGTGKAVNSVVLARWRALDPDDRLGSAASWGPWQLMYHTAVDVGFKGKPHELHDRATSEKWVDELLARIAATGAETVEQFADAWNSGNWWDKIIPGDYIRAVVSAYDRM